MNFIANSAKASEAFKQQKPTYLILPNFSIVPTTPTKTGPLELGTLVAELSRYRPLNKHPANRVPIPEDECYVSVIEDVSSTLNNSRGGEAGLFAKILEQSIGGDASWKGQRTNEYGFTIGKLETRYFYPSKVYVKKSLNLLGEEDFGELTQNEEPIYLITGLKIAWGATVTVSHGSGYEGKLQAGVEAPAGVVDLGVGANAGLSRENGQTSSYGKPRDFVLGVQLQKVRYKKKSLFSKGGIEIKDQTKGAVLMDDDEQLASSGPADDFEIELEDMTAAAVSGMELVGGEDAAESWLVPSEAT